MATSNNTMTSPTASDSQARKAVASFPSYAEAEHAVDSLSDQGVAVEQWRSSARASGQSSR